MFDKFALSRNIGIDLGNTNVVVFVEGKGIVIREPSVVAIDTTTDTVIKIGKEAEEMLGRTPENIEAVKPLSGGFFGQYELMLKMLKHFIGRASEKSLIWPKVMISVPTNITEVEQRAIIDASKEAGARKTILIEEPVAAAIGAGLDISSPLGNFIVDIGGGSTDIAVLSMGSVVVSDSIRVGGDKFDEAIVSYVRRTYNVLISERTAEAVKVQIGAVYDHNEAKLVDVKGRDLTEGLPTVVRLSSKEMMEALYEPVTAILDSICACIESTPPELVGDILQNGIALCGGGSLIFGLDLLINKVTGIRTYVAKNPLSCVAIGMGKKFAEQKHGKK